MEKTFYAGTPTYPVYSYAKGVKTYVGVAVDLREIEVDIELIMLNYDDLEKCDSDKYSALTVRDMDVLSIMIE